MGNESIDHVVEALSAAIERSYRKLEESRIDKEAAVDSLRHMDRLIALYQGNLPVSEFGAQLVMSGSNLFNDWISMQQIAGKEMKDDVKKVVDAFQQTERPDADLFIDAVYAMREQQMDWIFHTKTADPFFVTVLNAARICRRINDIDLQR